MLAANLLARKRDGFELTSDEIRFLIDGYCDGTVTDYQMSAFAMAVCIHGMTPGETAVLTRCMLESGGRLPKQVSGNCPRVDKHSTGGLGDKVSLILAPLLAACDVHVPMVSGRGLGISGGTLDKLEAIPGFRTDLSEDESSKVLRDVGAFIVSASESIAPADRKLYALRDVTGTVESIPLITASILSKKLSASLDALVMDVKVGNAAFMKSIEQAESLSESLKRVGAEAGLPTTALITDMDQPLGVAVGNANEVNESVAVLSGKGPLDDAVLLVRELTIQLCASVLVSVGNAPDRESAQKRLNRALDDGSAMERFERLIAAQGGRLSSELPLAESFPILSRQEGYVSRIDCHTIGSAVVGLGGGRRRLGDQIDPAVGIDVLVRVGDQVSAGQPIANLICHRAQKSDYLDAVGQAFELCDEPVPAIPLVLR